MSPAQPPRLPAHLPGPQLSQGGGQLSRLPVPRCLPHPSAVRAFPLATGPGNRSSLCDLPAGPSPARLRPPFGKAGGQGHQCWPSLSPSHTMPRLAPWPWLRVSTAKRKGPRGRRPGGSLRQASYVWMLATCTSWLLPHPSVPEAAAPRTSESTRQDLPHLLLALGAPARPHLPGHLGAQGKRSPTFSFLLAEVTRRTDRATLTSSWCWSRSPQEAARLKTDRPSHRSAPSRLSSH